MNKMILNLNTNNRLIIDSPVPIHDLALLQYIQIFFQTGDTSFLLYTDDSGQALSAFCWQLKQALQGTHILSSKIAKSDVGYFHNESDPLPVDERIARANKINTFLVWSALGVKPYLETWLYNDKQGNIIFHVTELYCPDYDKPSAERKRLYQEFMKNYKPLVVCTIPPEVAREWLEKCTWLLKVVEDNNPRYVKENNIQLFSCPPEILGKKWKECMKKEKQKK